MNCFGTDSVQEYFSVILFALSLLKTATFYEFVLLLSRAAKSKACLPWLTYVGHDTLHTLPLFFCSFFWTISVVIFTRTRPLEDMLYGRLSYLLHL